MDDNKEKWIISRNALMRAIRTLGFPDELKQGIFDHHFRATKLGENMEYFY